MQSIFFLLLCAVFAGALHAQVPLRNPRISGDSSSVVSGTLTVQSGATLALASGALFTAADPISLAAGGTGAALSDPGADRLLFWDDSAGAVTWLALGSGLSISGTTISSSSGFANPMTTAGDIITGGTAGAAQRVGVGTDGQILTVVSGAPAWAAAPTSGFANPMTDEGDLIVGGVDGDAGRLGIGSDGQVLKVVSGALAWAADSTGSGSLPATPAEGDLAVYDGADWISLGVGSAGEVLTAGASMPEWAAAPASGAPADATYIVQTASAGLSAEQALADLSTGLLKSTTGTGVLSIAGAGTDYVAPGAMTGSGLTMATARILGRTTASSGAVEEITIGSGLTLAAGELSASGGGGSGDVVGPGSATNNALALFDGTTGKLIKNGGATLASGVLAFSGAGTLTTGTGTFNLTLRPSGPGLIDIQKYGEDARERMAVMRLLDASWDQLAVTNGTTTSAVFAPVISSYVHSNSGLHSMLIRGLVRDTNDASDSAGRGIVAFAAARTNQTTNPDEGTLSAVAARKLYTFENAGTNLLAIYPASTRILQTEASTSTTTGALRSAGGLGVAGRTSTATLNVGGTNGTTINLVASATDTLDFPSIAAGGTEALTITVTGAAVGDVVMLGLPASVDAGVIYQGRVSAADTVTVAATNVTGSAIDPASATFRAAVASF